jgi:hypothetical protein
MWDFIMGMISAARKDLRAPENLHAHGLVCFPSPLENKNGVKTSVND